MIFAKFGIMESLFRSGFRSFLESSYIDFIEYGNSFIFPDYDFAVELVPAGVSASCGFFAANGVAAEQPGGPFTDMVYLYEDRWWSAKNMVQERILTRLERFRSIFARKCRVLSGRDNPQMADIVREFLQRHHAYSSAKCRYRYVLEYEGEIVAVATFSEGRPMVRKMDSPLQNVPKEEQENASILIFDSYEWIRYASLPGVRVVGGMGKLLNAFIEERYTRIEPGTPMEVMTYSDTEWSNGDVYCKLGFKYAGERAPVEYHVHKHTYTRYPYRLYEKELQQGALPDNFYTIHNLGSKKFLLQIL